MENKVIVEIMERCEKCGSFRVWRKWKNGMTEKSVHTPNGTKCKHKWLGGFKGNPFQN